MKIDCIIIDDEPLAIKVLEKYLSHVPDIHLLECFTSGTAGLQYLRQETVDAVFLDINMPDLDGMALLRTLDVPPLVIFTTAHPNYAVESYDYQALDYLLKPFSLERFLKAANRLIQKVQSEKEEMDQEGKQYLVVRADRKIHRIPYQDIYFLQAFGDYVKIRTTNGWITPKHTLTQLEQTLEANHFLRVHRAYIVNPDKVSYLEGNQLAIGNEKIPISKSQRALVLERLGLGE